jgi:hypothetical protein
MVVCRRGRQSPKALYLALGTGFAALLAYGGHYRALAGGATIPRDRPVRPDFRQTVSSEACRPEQIRLGRRNGKSYKPNKETSIASSKPQRKGSLLHVDREFRSGPVPVPIDNRALRVAPSIAAVTMTACSRAAAIQRGLPLPDPLAKTSARQRSSVAEPPKADHGQAPPVGADATGLV